MKTLRIMFGIGLVVTFIVSVAYITINRKALATASAETLMLVVK